VTPGTVIVLGAREDWPTALDEILARMGCKAEYVPTAHAAALAAATGVRAVLVEGRTISFGDVVVLRRLRRETPAVALIVVGPGSAASQEMKEALDSDATAFVPRSQLEALLPVALGAKG
jgi:hypothetical protein